MMSQWPDQLEFRWPDQSGLEVTQEMLDAGAEVFVDQNNNDPYKAVERIFKAMMMAKRTGG